MNVTGERSNTSLMREFQASRKGTGVHVANEETDLGTMDSKNEIDKSQSSVLNVTCPAALGAILCGNPDDAMVLISDADEQIMFQVAFREPCNITSICIRSGKPPPEVEDEPDDYAPPRTLKLFPNRLLDFSDAESVQPAMSIDLTEVPMKDEGEAIIAGLRGNKFTRVSSLSILVESNLTEAPHTFLNRLSVRGYPTPGYHR